MKITLLNAAVLFLALTSSVNAGTDSLRADLKRCLDGGVRFLVNNQYDHSLKDSVFRGEWPTKMCMRTGFFLLGGKREIDDSNCFSVSSIHNSLSRIYLLFPEYREILPALDPAFARIITFRNGNSFNFWNLLQPYRDLKRGTDLISQPLVRRPSNFKLGCRYINNAANVVEDADDTSLGWTAIALRKKITGKNDHPLPGSLSRIFDAYRDTNRKNRHWYNYLNGNDHETGAWLTWMGKEYDFKNWNILKVIGHNATFFLSFSECFPHAYKPYIPYGSNDLDGVVNANVLSALSVYSELSSARGTKAAVSYIEKKSKRKRHYRTGIYYPNHYHFPYAVSEAYRNGVSELQASVDNLVDYVLKNQDKDGGWSSRKIVNKKDRVQSTSYAMNTLINSGMLNEPEINEAILKGWLFLLKKAIKTEEGIHWEAGVFFSGGTVVRNTLYWKSEAYTTATILQAMARYLKETETELSSGT